MLIMSHIQIPAIDNQHLASASKPVIQDWLRKDWLWRYRHDGPYRCGRFAANQKIGDYAVASVVAGSDLILVDADTVHIDEVHRALTQAVANGTITNERLNEAVKRILSRKCKHKFNNN